MVVAIYGVLSKKNNFFAAVFVSDFFRGEGGGG